MHKNKPSSKPVFVFECVDLSRTFREWKSPLLSVELVFIKIFEELALAHRKLLEKGKEFEFHDVDMKNKWERLKQKQAEFINNVKKYDAFFIENEEKSNRILHKTKSKIKQRGNFDEDIYNCHNRIEFLTAVESKLENSVEMLAPFQNFLEELVNNMKNFECPSDLINCYVLINAETQLLGKLHHAMLDREMLHKLISSCLKNKMMVFHKQNNAIFYRNEECTDKLELKNKLELELLNQAKSNQKIITDVLVLRHCCNNIFSRLLKWKKTKCLRNIDAEKKYTFIIDTVKELREAVELARQLDEKKDASSQADSSFITCRRIM